jgi:acetoin utilization deacetylase AcuC-like enzyme
MRFKAVQFTLSEARRLAPMGTRSFRFAALSVRINLRIYTHPVFYKHDTGVGHPESASRLDAALEGVDRAGLSDRIVRDTAPHADTDRIIAKVHSADYRRELDEACRMGMQLFHSLDNPISSQSFAAARAAVGTALTAAADVLSGNRAFVVARPPGHHAERLEAMGFCFFNTIACVAEWMLEQQGMSRILVFDFDVHHGNGTQALFEDREDVFYLSMHRYPFYPGTGALSEIGINAGRGFTKNIPMDAGLGDAAYLRATEDVVMRVIDAYRPSAILLSAGFDAHRRDPLGGMRVSEQCFGEMTRRVMEAAQRDSAGRVLSLLEGGYDMEGLAASVAEHVNALA